jgi:hypothetical protein
MGLSVLPLRSRPRPPAEEADREQRIRERAYFIWLDTGCPLGKTQITGSKQSVRQISLNDRAGQDSLFAPQVRPSGVCAAEGCYMKSSRVQPALSQLFGHA